MAKHLILATPVPFGPETVTALDFADPTGRDIRELPLPSGIGGMDAPAMARWIERLTGRPQVLIDRLSLADWMAAAAVVGDFFAEAAPKKAAAAPTNS